MTAQDASAPEELVWLRRLRVASMLEGSTLLLLLCIAVPLKHLGELPAATAVMGPTHGVCFLLYVCVAMNALAVGYWSRLDTARVLVAPFLPGGAFFNLGYLNAREAAVREVS